MPGWVTLTNRATGQDELVAAETVNDAIASGKYVDPGAVASERSGAATYTSPAVAAREQTFAPPVDPAQAAIAHGHTLRAQENAGIGGLAKATLSGGVSGLTFGLASPFEDAREFHPLAAGVGELAGAIAPAFVGDVGGLFGLGREAAIGEDALTAERAASGISSKAAYAGETAAGTAEHELVRASSKVGQAADVASAQRVVTPIAEQAARPALEDLDLAGLKAEREHELGAIDAARQPERQAFVDEFRAANDATQEAQPWRYSKGSPNKFIRGNGKEALEADIKVRTLLKNEVGLAEKPERALDALQRQYQAYDRLLESAQKEVADFQHAFEVGPERVRAEILGGNVEGYVPSALSERGIDQAVHNEMIRRFGSVTAPVLPERLQSVGAIEETLSRNMSLQRRLAQLATEPTSARLEQIDSMLAARSAPHQASFGERAMHSIAPYLGPVGHAAEKAYGAIRKLVGGATKRAAGAASSFVDTTAKAATRAAPTVPMIATRILAAAAFAPSAAAIPSAVAPSKTAKPDLAALYQKHADEVRSQTAYNAAGVPEMRQAARLALGSQLDALRLKSPILADRVETVLAKRMEYVSSILPRQPDIAGGQVGPSNWQPSDMQMRSHARSVAAVEDPHAVLERAVHGSVTPEDVAALKAVYPEILADFTNTVATQLPTLRQSLPHGRKLALSMLTGVPVDPAMHPGVLRILQGQFTNDEGAPQTQAPKAQPQFGSISKPDPTPAQRRAEGAHA